MVHDRTRRIWLHAVEIAYALLVGAWYLLPYFGVRRELLVPLRLPFILSSAVPDPGTAYPARLYADIRAGAVDLPLLLGAGFMACALPALLAVKMCAPFFAKRVPALFDPLRPLPRVFGIMSSLFALLLLSLHVLRFASSFSYFQRTSHFTYGFAGASLLANVFSAVALARAVKRRDGVYREYREFAMKVRIGKSRLLAAFTGASIRKRLVLSFAGITISAIGVLSMSLLSDFRRTIDETLRDNAMKLTERSASAAAAILTDVIAMEEYFEAEKQKNIGSRFAYESLSYYQWDDGKEMYLARGSTDETLLNRELPGEYARAAKSIDLYDPTQREYVVVTPHTFKVKEKPFGFSVVVYDRDRIYEPYFRTTVKVLLFGAAFVYVAALLVYILGSNIALPILYLRMNVNKISTAISDMMAGRAKVSAAALDYKDAVKTRDEIKTLSTEIGRMTTVIRGVVPYISASTLKHAHRDGLVSEKRELAFLFTDIRGFTSICEGLEPEKVVGILNRYLDLQSGIILRNGGDIDKFVGDGIMAMFEGEDKEMKACRTAMQIREAMAAAGEGRAREEKTITIGMGINAGPVVFGSVGAKDRMDFTSIGDTVNLAARLEGANKEYATKSLIGEAVFGKVKNRYVCREIDALTVKGKSRPVRVYEILQEKEKASKTVLELGTFFESGLHKYRRKEWDRAEKEFRYLADAYRDETSAVFIDRIAFFRRNPPPADWDGVFRLQVK